MARSLAPRRQDPGARSEKCTEILEQGRFEREKLLSIQQQLTCRCVPSRRSTAGALELVRTCRRRTGAGSPAWNLERHSSGPTAEIPAAHQLPMWKGSR